jgi:hypothetical protein
MDRHVKATTDGSRFAQILDPVRNICVNLSLSVANIVAFQIYNFEKSKLLDPTGGE